MKTKRFLSFFAVLLLCLSANAQFYTSGEDPGGLKWYSISSDNFKIIYAEGLDSLARVYGRNLEKYRTPVGASIGFKPNELYRKPMPVILHSYMADANGVVTWTPHRMELYTGPDAHQPDVLQWEPNLAMHESRHVAQMQAGRMRGFGVFNWLGGELFSGAFSALYGGPFLFEGDAVVTETALSASGRGRSADFLEYYRVSFDAGDFRDWYQWLYGSLDKYTPNHYAAGYMLLGGIRYTYDEPLFTKKFYDNIRSRRGLFPLLNLQKTTKDVSGQKLRKAWQEICRTQNALWKADELARGPFTEPVQFTPDTRRYTEYDSPTVVGNDIIALRHGITSSTRLVKIDSLGQPEVLRPFSGTASALQYSEPLKRIFWSESIPDVRWTMASSSRIYSSDPSGRDIRAITKKGRFYNPAPSPVDGRVAVTEYPAEGGTAIVVLNGSDGAVLECYQAPDTLQVVEAAWMEDGRIAASAISASGFGIYSVTDGYTTILAPRQAKIKQLRSYQGTLNFVSDRNGVNELYTISDGIVKQLSNNRFGASDFIIGKDSLTFAALTVDGRKLYRSAPEEKVVDYSELYHHPVADKLSEQEAALGYVADSDELSGTAGDGFSEPERYRKLPHIFHFHSWLPLFVNYDDVSNLSFESLTSYGILGATAFFQNHLDTANGLIGYSAEPTGNGWVHGAHAKLTYSGLFPVFEISANLENTTRSVYRSRYLMLSQNRASLSLDRTFVDGPYFTSSAKVYVPLNFSSGGWTRGVIPQASLSFSNNVISGTESFITQLPAISSGESSSISTFLGSRPGKDAPLTKLSASLRAYTMLSTAHSGIFPRWGIGAELGYGFRPADSGMFTPNAYAFTYGYIPGILDTHGIKLTAMSQLRFDGKFSESHVKVLPRGIISPDAQSYIARRFPIQSKFTFDYVMPLLPLDCSWFGQLAYVRNVEVNGFFDYGLYGGSETFGSSSFYSAGAVVELLLSNFLWIPYDTKLGVSCSWSGGKLWDKMEADKYDMGSPFCISAVFSIDL